MAQPPPKSDGVVQTIPSVSEGCPVCVTRGWLQAPSRRSLIATLLGMTTSPRPPVYPSPVHTVTQRHDSVRRPTNSATAAGHSGYSNTNPESTSRLGTTRRLLSTSSDSVRSRRTPTSSIPRVAGSPIGM